MLKTSFPMQSSLRSGPVETPLKPAPRAPIQRHFATARPVLSSRIWPLSRQQRDGGLVYINAAPDLSMRGGPYGARSVADRSSRTAALGTPRAGGSALLGNGTSS